MLDYRSVAKLTGLAVQTLRQYKAEGTMPIPDRYVMGSPVWTESQIDEWMQARTRGVEL